ncbi:uncharacterized protein LOC131946064 isoform X2 [Physella acuta]|uniref:uncharacterized protein LOC131946064 isoform X2 n=1 Tax=Physella acuta TaxID=109671 RepID=UPI0027DC93F5|nr:uncharacterized protein LOC131946064 isoform X2 [Physella acuta]
MTTVQTPGSPKTSSSTTLNPDSEQELLRLMQQTDDAKVREMNARLGTCVSAPPTLDVDSPNALKSQSLSSVEVSKVDGTTEEEIRASSAQSRASLRHQYKVKLGEAKLAAEDRRSKSPAIQLTTQITIDDDLILEEEEDDEFGDSSVIDTSTSPLPEHKSVSRLSSLPNQESKDPSGIQKLLSAQRVQKIITKGISLLEHPLLKEYLKVYDGVLGFKDAVGKIFLDKDYMSAHQMMSDLEAVTFDRTKKAMPQIEELTQNVLYVLEEVSSLVNSVLVFEREPPVSALNAFSRETTQQPPNEFSQDQELSPSLPKDSSVVSLQTSNLSDQLHIKELQDQYMQLQQQLEEDRRNHQEQIQHNTVVMMEMQETINDLQRELSSLEKSPMRTKSALSNGRGANVYHKSPSPEASVMFTRLDSERNAKIMKKAVMTDKLDPEKYKEAVSRMDEYVSLPAQRFVHLVQKYVHHMRMKEIEEKVKNSSSIDGEVYQVLNKMENLQNKRAKQWAKKMDEMGLERLKLANLLMDTLDNIEQESGLFLIKPMYSYHAREARPVYGRKRTVATKLRQSVVQTKDTGGSFIPAPTPANNFRHIRHDHLQQLVATSSDKRVPDPVYDNRQVKVTGNGMTSSLSSAKGMWNMQASHSWNYKDDIINSLNTPRILELDINRMLIGQNNISTKVPFPQSEDRLVNAHQNTLRSYVTVNRPTAPLGGDTTERRPSSGRDSASSGGSSKSSKRVVISEVDREIPAAMPAAAPLPPIAPVSGPREDSQDSLGSSTEPPRSPAGSSLHPSAHDPHSRQSGRYSTPTDTDNEM